VYLGPSTLATGRIKCFVLIMKGGPCCFLQRHTNMHMIPHSCSTY
jgi:hypothetical protein